MPLHSLKDHISEAISLSPAARTASANGTGVDLAGFESACCVAAYGVWTDGTHTVKLQDSDDNSSFADVAAGFLDGAFTAVSASGGSNTTQRVSYTGGKRYVRAVLTVSGATTGALSAAVIVRGDPR